MEFNDAMNMFSNSGGGLFNGSSIGASGDFVLFKNIDVSFESAQKKVTPIAFGFMSKFFDACQGIASSFSPASMVGSLVPPPGIASAKVPGIISARGK